MKKIFILIAMACMTMGAWADDFWEDGNLYVITDAENKIVKVTVSNSAGEVEFPETVTHDAVEYKLTEIGDGSNNVFSDADRIVTITKIILSKNITAVAANAFKSCDNLTEVVSYSSSFTTGDDAFRGSDAIGWDGIAKQCKFLVPEGATENFKTSSWSIYDIFYENHNIRERSWPKISSIGYATYYNSYAYKMPEKVEGYIVKSAGSGALSLTKVYDPGEVVETGLALLWKYTEDMTEDKWPYVEIMSSGSTEIKDVDNGGNLLYGTDIDDYTRNETGCKYYRLANNATYGLGWYYGAEGGGQFQNKAHKAYLEVPTDPLTPAPQFFPLYGTTDISTTVVPEMEGEMVYYNLAGQRVENPTKGLYIVNGKKVIIK